MKLNLKMLANTVAVFLLLNLFLIVGLFFFTLQQAENDMASILETRTINNQRLPEYWQEEAFGFTIESTGDELAGQGIFALYQDYSALKEYNVSRRVLLAENTENFLQKITGSNYRVHISEEELLFTYNLGSKMEGYLSFFYILFIFEVLLLLRSAYKGIRSARNILRPLSDMTARAQTLTTKGGNAVSSEEMKRLRELAGTISSIDATRLDQRLPVDGAQKELKELAVAINSMLNRIDDAYRSQMRFVSDASHELRTPIAVVQGYANLLDRWGKNDEATMQEAIDAIKSESDNMKDLIEQLLFLARGDNETLALYLETFDCRELVGEIINETVMIHAAHTFRQKEGDPVYIHADRQLMKQALRILVDNSIKYSDEGGEIILSVTSEKGLANITVQDDGIGIEPDKLPYIFERFYRAEESRTRKTGGAGLGLSIMKWIIDRHNGTIEVVSRKGIGTKTTLLLPVAEPLDLEAGHVEPASPQ